MKLQLNYTNIFINFYFIENFKIQLVLEQPKFNNKYYKKTECIGLRNSDKIVDQQYLFRQKFDHRPPRRKYLQFTVCRQLKK